MKVELKPLSEVEPYGKNAKKHPVKQVKKIADSIKEFGFNQPIVVDRSGVIIVGHGRYLAAQQLGLTEVPVLTLDIDDEKAKTYRLADNKLNESEWDMDLVVKELKLLSLPMIDLSGFSRKLAVDLGQRDDDVPEMPKVARTQYGDIYHLGHHKIMCGDSTKESDYTKLMGGVKADMVFTDPPYNVNYSGGGKNTSTTILNDKMETSQFLEFLKDCFKVMKSNIKQGAAMYIFHSPTTQTTFEQALNSNGIQVKYQLIWNKPSGGMGMGDYRQKHEPFFYCGIKDSGINFYGDRTNTTIIDFQKSDQALAEWAKKQKEAEREGRTTIWTMKRENVQDYVHPTQKPVELIMYAINNSSKVDDIVLDMFLGSGSALIACDKTNRICYGSELDPKFVDVIVQRYVDFTGNKEILKNNEKIIW